MHERHRTPMGPLLTMARAIVARHGITVAAIRDREACPTRDAQKLFDKTVLRRAVVEAKTVDELKQVLHEVINLL